MMKTTMVEALSSVEDGERGDVDKVWQRIKDTQVFLDPPVTMSNSEISAHQQRKDVTRLVLVSDTHGSHRDIQLPAGDVLIHAGDFTRVGEWSTIQDLTSWFKKVSPNFSNIVCIAGNHDLPFHPEHYEENWRKFGHRTKLDPEKVRASLQNCTYLEDSSCVVHGDLECYGSPWTPFFFNWAFNSQRGDDILQKWQQIPESTDILVTHGPPLGRGDVAEDNEDSDQGRRTGCFDLLKEVQTRIRPRVHIFGHIHESRGLTYDGHTLFVNACNVNLEYEAVHQCYVIDVPHDKSRPAVVVQPNCRVRNTELRSWVDDRDFPRLAKAMDRLEKVEALPSGNDLLQEDALTVLCEAMGLHRDKSFRGLLRKALSQMYVESFNVSSTTNSCS